MSGGSRTFPKGGGAAIKWKWKRMQEKLAGQKPGKAVSEAKILQSIAGNPKVSAGACSSTSEDKQQIKALADRFRKEGAVDLWNEDDGPLTEPVGPLLPPRRKALPELTPASSLRVSTHNCGDLKRIGDGSGKSDFSGFSGLRGVRLEGDGEGFRGEMFKRGFSTFSRLRFNEEDGFGTGILNHLNFRRIGQAVVRRGFLTSSVLNSGTEFTILQKNFVLGSVQNANLQSKNLIFLRNFGHSPGRRKSGNEANQRNDSSLGLKKNSVSRISGNRRKRRWVGCSDSEDDDEDDNENDDSSKGRVHREMDPDGCISRKYEANKEGQVKVDVIKMSFADSIRKELEFGDTLLRLSERVVQEGPLSRKRFDECDISPLTVKALSSAGYEQMTVIQEACLQIYLEGKDVLVKAQTSAGKSIAFLIPTIEAVLKAASDASKLKVPPVVALVLCPTRELASQIAAEARVLLRYHTGLGVITLTGGTRLKDDLRMLESDSRQIIVATPGRLLDHIENKSGFSVYLRSLKMFILDEADSMLDLGFRKDIEKIVDCVPSQRQSILFSATVFKELRRISQLVLKKDHVYIDTLGLANPEATVKVEQSCVVVPHDMHLYVLCSILKEHIEKELDYKIIVFCATAMVTSLMHLLLMELKMNTREIHPRMPQPLRARISDEFRESKRIILVASDVLSEDMNYPDVTLVVQVGIPCDRQQYLYRLGHTGHERKGGKCVLLIAPWEEYFLDEVNDLPIQKSPLPHIQPQLKDKVRESLGKIDSNIKEAAYHAWLGYYYSIRETGMDTTRLVELAQQFALSMGLERSPSMLKNTGPAWNMTK